MTNWQTASSICACGEFTEELSYHGRIIAYQCPYCCTLDWALEPYDIQDLLDTGFPFDDLLEYARMYVQGEQNAQSLG